MKRLSMSSKTFCRLSGACAIVAVLLLFTSFMINSGPPPNATVRQLIEFARRHAGSILWGAWLQAIGPVFIVLFSAALVRLSGTALRVSGLMTIFGASVLMTVS